LKALAFMDAYSEMEGLKDPQELHSRIHQWLSP
jgi:hypothetical protein